MNIKLKAASLLSAAKLLDYPTLSTTDEYKTFVAICKELGLLIKNVEYANIRLSELEAEYIRLFVSNYEGVGAPPYASFYTDKRLMGKAAVDMLNFYHDCGYRFDHDTVKEPPDHITFEITFLSKLIEEGKIGFASMMIEKHLNWLGKFEKLVKKNACLNFYPSVVYQVPEVIASIKEDLC